MPHKVNPIILFVKESWLLVVAALVFGMLLSGINAAWSPKIQANKQKKIQDAIVTLIPQTADAQEVIKDELLSFNEMDSARITIFKVLDENGILAGWSFTATGAGYADKIDLMIAVDPEFNKLLGYKVIFSNETTGFGDKIKDSFYKEQFADAPAGKLKLSKLGDASIIDDEIIAISGATISSSAVIDIFNKYVDTVKELMTEKGLLK